MEEETINETEQLTARVAELEGQLTTKDAALSEAAGAAGGPDIVGTIKKLQAANAAAVVAYRKLAVSSNPIFTDELITGNSIDEVDAAMKKVTGLAEGIKTRLEAELKATIVPAGAPERSGPDASGLSPREKIKAGLNK